MQIAGNVCNRMRAMGLTCDTASGIDLNSQQKQPDILLIDEGDTKMYPNIPWIAVEWSRPATFVGEFLRKPIRSKQLIDALRRSFKAPPIGTHMCVVWLYCCGCNVWL